MPLKLNIGGCQGYTMGMGMVAGSKVVVETMLNVGVDYVQSDLVA